MAKLVNVTATFQIRLPFELPERATLREYVSKTNKIVVKFPGAILKKYNVTFIIFRTGKIVCVGGRDMNYVKQCCYYFARSLHRKVYHFQIKNLVATMDLPYTLNLDETEKLIKSSYRTSYDVELFAALVIHAEKCTVILFHTGKVNFTGTKDVQHMKETWFDIEKFLTWKRKC